MGKAQVEFRILGPLEVIADGHGVRLPRGRARALLAALLLRAGQAVSIDELVSELWSGEPPRTAANVVQAYVSRLRKAFAAAGAADLLVSAPPGYRLRAASDQIDAGVFAQLAEAGRAALAAGAAEAAAAQLREALGLWHGAPLPELADDLFAQGEIARLEEARMAALEDRIEADLELGRHAELVPELEALVTANPLRERPRGQLMLALYRSGRQAEALEAYREARRLLVDELGIEPGTALRALERAILEHAPALEPVEASDVAEVAGVGRTTLRKQVSLLFGEVTATTSAGEALDPEALRRVLVRVYDVAAELVERYGGVAEKLVGDTVLGVFGVPDLHEDDALRAIRAGADLVEAVPELNEELEPADARIELQLGVSTGEMVVGDEAVDVVPLTGEAVSGGLALARAARPGELLLDALTAQLVGGAARVEAEGGVHRLVELLRGRRPISAQLERPMVGRRHELGQLEHAFERAIRDRSCRLVTVLGAAGIGKSRLARELRSLVEERAIVLEGRCLPYGEGITFWPLREMVEQLVGRGGARAIAALLGDEDEAELIAERVAGATGGTAGGSAGEATFWAARRLFEALGRRRPLVLIVDDLQWAEATFLDLVEHLAVRARAAPILLVGLARTELLERRAEWGGGVTNAVSVVLEPLTDPESEQLLLELPEGAALSAAERARLVAASEGNPLFVEQLIQMLRDGVELEEWPPPTIHALLAARVDRLQREERDVLSVGAVIGKEFWHDAVAALLPEADPSDIERSLDGLVRKELIRPAHSGIPATEAFRFRHLLIRDAAYRSLPKEARVELHERFADWLEHAAGEQAPEEILGYHLESAFRYAVELGAVDEHARTLAARAAAELATAGRRAYARADMPAATALLARAADLPADDAARLPVLADLADALREEGELARASSVLDGLAAAAARAGDAATQAYARMVGFRVRMQTVAGFGTGELVEACAEAISLYERTGDEGRLARAWFFLAQVPWYECHAAEAEKALERATLYARRAGDERALAWSLNLLLASHLFGPRPVDEGVSFCRELIARRGVQRRIEASACRALAGLRAMAGDFTEAERLIDRDKSLLEDLGLRVIAGVAAEVYGTVWLLAGEAKRAEHELRTGSEALERLGEKSVLSNVLGLLARTVYEQGRYDEALELSARGEEVAALDDLSARVHWTGPRALVLARRGDPAALPLARAAADDASRADLLPLKGQALLDLAEVLRLFGREAEARSALDDAIAVFERKGSRAGAERARSMQAIGAH